MGDWAGGARSATEMAEREGFHKAVQKAIDEEAAGQPGG